MANPDSLADLGIGHNPATWEQWMSPTMPVIYARTGRYGFASDLDAAYRMRRDPSGSAWEEAKLAALFPRLAARYGWTTS